MGFFKRHLVPAFLTAAVLFTFSPLVPTAGAAYADAENTWAAEVIEKAGKYGLMEGRPDGTFGVGVNMTRAEFVTVVCRMMGWAPQETVPQELFDVPGHWAQGYIAAAAAHGAVERAGAFRPDDYISRSEMAVMLVRALGYDGLAQSLGETDLPFPDVAQDRGYIALAYGFGIINGVEEKEMRKFLPTFSAPREQAAAMLVRCYERLELETQWLHGFYAFNSYPQLELTAQMDGVSVGWARLEADESGQPRVNSTEENGNDWVKPDQSELTTDFLAQRSIPCNLNIFGSATTFLSLVEAGNQAAAIAQLTAAAQPYAGLTIDIEGLRTEQREAFTAFMSALRQALPEGQTLYVCVQPDTWFGGFDYRALGEICDRVILMAHDYQWSSIPDYYLGTANTYCPVTPLDKVSTALQHITDPETGVQDRSKLALAISFNTTGFHVDEQGLLVDQTFYHPAYTTIAKRLQQEDTVYTWDEQSQNPYIEYTTENGEHYKLWYENAPSVEAKLKLARMYGITGVSIWRVGMIPTYGEIENYDVWSTLKMKN
ncbi:MAG: hypothetical protein HFF06_09005 [Oscillospiraceae bacterium]|nr:hypothetical protein [Oscillospiraceae bacterium]